MQQQHARRTQVIGRAPQLDLQWVNAIAAADMLWGVDDKWRQAVDRQSADNTVEQGLLELSAAGTEDDGLPNAAKRRRRLNSFRRGRSADPASGSSSGDPTTVRPVAGDFVEFDVPRPGRVRRSPGRGRSWTVRLVLVSAPLMLAGGAAYAVGVSAGSARITAPAAISASEAAQYHLSTYPAEQAAAYGATYLTLCLTHPDPADKTAVADRLAGLARMVSAGVTAGCGWDGTGTAQQPQSITWAGTATPAPAATYTSGQAAQLGFLITYPGGRTGGVSIPIWAGAADSYTGLRVVGDVAVMPATPPTAAPTAKLDGTVDSELSQSLPGQVLLPFLRSWAASDTVQLNLVLTTDATGAARTGLDGQVSDPTINRAQILTDKATTSTERVYDDGDTVTALLSVDWTTGAGAGQRTSYVITLHRSAGRWQVHDISGSAADPAGGAATGTAFTTS